MGQSGSSSKELLQMFKHKEGRGSKTVHLWQYDRILKGIERGLGTHRAVASHKRNRSATSLHNAAQCKRSCSPRKDHLLMQRPLRATNPLARQAVHWFGLVGHSPQRASAQRKQPPPPRLAMRGPHSRQVV